MTKTNNNTFSGEIDIEDFSTYLPNKKRINKYAEADNLQKNIEKNLNKINMEEKYKKMTFDDLKTVEAFSRRNGMPSNSYTNEKWEEEFEIMKLITIPTSETKMSGKYSRESGFWNEESMRTYYGATNWQDYCKYINDVLSNIRANQVDYCYYFYQIADLLRFHLNELQTRYCDGYWEVWLERMGK